MRRRPPDPLIAHIGEWYDQLLSEVDESYLRDRIFAAYGEWLQAPSRTIPDDLWELLQLCGFSIPHPLTQFFPTPPKSQDRI